MQFLYLLSQINSPKNVYLIVNQRLSIIIDHVHIRHYFKFIQHIITFNRLIAHLSESSIFYILLQSWKGFVSKQAHIDHQPQQPANRPNLAL